MQNNKQKDKSELLEHLKKLHAFWSYQQETDQISDDLLIEKVLIHLDIDDIVKLNHLYPKEKIFKIWEDKLLTQNSIYYSLNRFYAFWLFGIKKPDKFINDYLKSLPNA